MYNNQYYFHEYYERVFFGISLKKGGGASKWVNGTVCILKQPPYSMSLPVNWLDDPYTHRSWRWILNGFQWMDGLLADYKFQKNIKSIELCVEYFLDWINFYITQKNSGEFLWKDDAVSFRTFRISILAKYVFLEENNYSEIQRRNVMEVLRLHYLELSDPKKFKTNNHGIFQIRALMSLLALHPYIGDLDVCKKYSVEKINWLWIRQYGKQNIHLENSTGYHCHILKEFEEILLSPEFDGFEFCYDLDTVKKVKENTKYLFHPNGVGTLFGDSNYSRQTHETAIGDHLFNEAGYAVLAGNNPGEDNSYLAVRTGFPSNAHRHSDDFSFEWSESGVVILQDSGRYSYDYESDFRKFVSGTRAHNTVSVNGCNYPWWGDFKKNDFYEDAINYYSGMNDESTLILEKYFHSLEVNFKRKIIYSKGKRLIISDNLTSKNNNSYEQWFHFSKDFEYFGTDKLGRTIFKSSKIAVAVEALQGSEVFVVKGQMAPFIQGWISYGEREISPRWSIGFKKEGRECLFEVDFSFVDMNIQTNVN
ncbi:heparinase II/III family protein [Comamonas thiooxydans]|uniref:heparinase II/III domain-containing protein n=1 Tax=Comamonas thiooxydans TaxID=363952 RepID=UPI000B34F847|nr:heparinase II/III family protein [Comamonas thiooxydans]BDR09828.1 heparinase II/III family protein [Comamonas thiooxydans]